LSFYSTSSVANQPYDTLPTDLPRHVDRTWFIIPEDLWYEMWFPS